MTYKTLIDTIEKAAIESPGVKSFYYGDLENLNKQSNILYPRISLVPTPHEFISSSLTNYTFTMVYVDRLTETRFKRDIQSVAITTLKDIINRVKGWSEAEELFDDQPYSVSFTTVNVYNDPQRFADALSGAYMNIDIEVKDENGDCYYDED